MREREKRRTHLIILMETLKSPKKQPKIKNLKKLPSLNTSPNTTAATTTTSIATSTKFPLLLAIAAGRCKKKKKRFKSATNPQNPATKNNANLKRNKAKSKIPKFRFELTFRRLHALRFTFLRNLSVLFAGGVAVGFELVVPRHLALRVALPPRPLLISTSCDKTIYYKTFIYFFVPQKKNRKTF